MKTGEQQGIGETLIEYVTVFLGGLGLAMELPVFLGGCLLAASGAVLVRMFMSSRRAVGVAIGASIFFAVVAALFNQYRELGYPPQLVMALAGGLSPLILPWLAKNAPDLADKWIAGKKSK